MKRAASALFALGAFAKDSDQRIDFGLFLNFRPFWIFDFNPDFLVK
jgi:hypothetical protein